MLGLNFIVQSRDYSCPTAAKINFADTASLLCVHLWYLCSERKSA